jgi:large subunit ribosomal protein L35
MPKMKTHKGTAKRIRVTGSGKLVRKIAGMSHFQAKKTRSRKRRLKGMRAVAHVDQKRMVSLLGVKPVNNEKNPEGGNDQS